MHAAAAVVVVAAAAAAVVAAVVAAAVAAAAAAVEVAAMCSIAQAATLGSDFDSAPPTASTGARSAPVAAVPAVSADRSAAPEHADVR